MTTPLTNAETDATGTVPETTSPNMTTGNVSEAHLREFENAIRACANTYFPGPGKRVASIAITFEPEYSSQVAVRYLNDGEVDDTNSRSVRAGERGHVDRFLDRNPKEVTPE